MIVENGVRSRVETRRGHFLGNGNAHGIRDALPERTSGALDALRLKRFRMPRRHAVKLAKILQLLHREVVAGKVEP